MTAEKSTDPTVRIAMTVAPIDHERLKHTAVDYKAPAAVIARALVNYGLDHLADDPAIDAALTEAALAERNRRSAAARQGGRRGGGSNKKKENLNEVVKPQRG